MPIGTIVHNALTLTDEAPLYELYDAVNVMHGTTPLEKLEFFAIGPGEPEVYRYKITAVDARVWSQKIDFLVSALDPLMTFNVSDKWKISEFALQRPVRDALVLLYTSVGLREITITMA